MIHSDEAWNRIKKRTDACASFKIDAIVDGSAEHGARHQVPPAREVSKASWFRRKMVELRVDRVKKTGIYFEALLKTRLKFSALRKQQTKFKSAVSKNHKV